MKGTEQEDAIVYICEKGCYIDDSVIHYNNKVLKQYIGVDGHYNFRVNNRNGKRMTIRTYRLIAYKKYGTAIFDDGVKIRHIDSNPLNDKDSNIEISSARGISMARPAEVRKAHAVMAAASLRKFDHEKVAKYHDDFNSYNDTMQKFDIKSKATVHLILKNANKLNKP